MKSKVILVFFILALGGLIFTWLRPVAASPANQAAFPSPTPGPDGRIIYKVQPGDTCERISLLFNVTVQYIRTSNLLDENCTIIAGQPLLIGIAAPPTQTAPASSGGTSPTPTLTPTPAPGAAGSAKICVLVYDDINGDGLRQETEPAIAGAALSLTNPEGTFSQTKTTEINPDATAYQGMCFEDVPPGKYNISAAAPQGYNPTVDLTSNLDVNPGDVSYVNFGAQEKAAAAEAPQPKGPSPLWGIIGAGLLLGGVGLGVYAWRIMRKS